MEVAVKVKLLKHNLEYLIGCLCQLESITGSESLLKKRAINIIEHSISQFLKDESEDNLKWIIESTNTFLRFYPENIFNSKVEILDGELNRLYSFINQIVGDLNS